jgi:hypothetical protein
MVIRNFNPAGFAVFKDKTYTPLIVYAYAILPLPISFQGFQIIAGRVFQVIQRLRGIKLAQLTHCPVLHIARKLA